MTKRIDIKTIAILITYIALLAVMLACCSPQYYPVPVPA